MMQAVDRPAKRARGWERKWDVLIVGAGPAGSFLAYRLSGRGFRVLLIDKAAFPRDKVCGGGISRKSHDFLNRHGIDISPVVQEKVSGCLLSYDGGDTVFAPLGSRGGVTVLRSEFDHLLLNHAIAAGASFLPGCRFLGLQRTRDACTVGTTRGEFKARFVIGADGAFSRVRKAVFHDDPVRYVPAVEALLRPGGSDPDLFRSRALLDFGSVPRGYAWIFPKRDHWNVGVYSPFGCRRAREHLDHFIARIDSLRRCTSLAVKGFAIPIENSGCRFEASRVWLVGDAGGFVEAFYGEGIYYALRTAEVAATALDLGFHRPERRTYSNLLRECGLPTELKYSRWNAGLFYRRQKFGFYRLARNPRMNDLFADIVAGRAGHRECFFKTLAFIPFSVLPLNRAGGLARPGGG